MDIWEEFREYCWVANLLPGMCFETTLLGKVLWVELDTGECTGLIPKDLQKEAKRNGFLIEAALYKENKYVLRVLKLAPKKWVAACNALDTRTREKIREDFYKNGFC